MSEHSTAPPTEADGRLARLRQWSAGHPYRTAAIGGAIIALTGATLTAWLVLAHYAAAPPRTTINTALAALDRGDDDRAAVIVEELRQQQSLSDEEMGGPLYVLGVLKIRDAERQNSLERRVADYLVASKFLERARAIGWPKGREADGLRKLGECLINAGELEEGVEVLNTALESNSANAGELYLLLAEAKLAAPAPLYKEAIIDLDSALKDPTLEDPVRSSAILRRIRTLTRMGQVVEAQAALAAVSPESDPARQALIQGEIYLAGPEPLDRAALEKAAALFDQAISLDKGATEITSSAQLHIAEVLELQGAADEALAQYQRVRRSFNGALEGVAAAVAEGELLLRQQRVEPAMTALRRGLEVFSERGAVAEGAISPAEFRQRMLSIHQQLIDAKQFVAAEELVNQFGEVFPHSRQTELLALTRELWGRHLLEGSSPAAPSTEVLHFARRQLRSAGLAYESLAEELYASPRYPDELWRCANAYFQGQNFSSVVRIVNKYLAVEPARRNPPALVMLGESLLAINQTENAISAFEECIEFYPADPASYSARLLCAVAYLDQRKPDRAEALLRQNLDGSALTPNSREWRSSQFELGRLLCESQRFKEAAHTLEEVLERLADFPDLKQERLTRYLLAEAYRHTADGQRDKLTAAQTLNEREQSRRMEVRLLEQSLEQYRLLQREITLDSEGDSLDRAMLRNCYMLQGSVLFQLERFSEAIEAYSNVSTSWQNEPFVLETLVQISNCWWRLNDPHKARGALEQAKLVLARLPEDADFVSATNFTRPEWNSLLVQMGTWYPQTP